MCELQGAKVRTLESQEAWKTTAEKGLMTVGKMRWHWEDARRIETWKGMTPHMLARCLWAVQRCAGHPYIGSGSDAVLLLPVGGRERQEGEAILVNNSPFETTLRPVWDHIAIFPGEILASAPILMGPTWWMFCKRSTSQFVTVGDKFSNTLSGFWQLHYIGCFFWWYCLQAILVLIVTQSLTADMFWQVGLTSVWCLAIH